LDQVNISLRNGRAWYKKQNTTRAMDS